MKIAIAVAADNNNGIGFKNQLLCYIKEDLQYFRKLTTGNIVLMGKNTYESIGKPLPNRVNIVISRSVKEINGCYVFDTIERGIEFAREYSLDNGFEDLYIIGGASIYDQTINIVDTIYLTRIYKEFEADTFFPKIPNSFKLENESELKTDDNNSFCFKEYKIERS